MSTDVIEGNETWYHCEIKVSGDREESCRMNGWPTEMYAGCPPLIRMILTMLSGLNKQIN